MNKLAFVYCFLSDSTFRVAIRHAWKESTEQEETERLARRLTRETRDRVNGVLRASKVASCLEFARRRPRSTHQQLATELGGESMVPALLIHMMHENVKTSDDFDYLLKSVLVRDLMECLSVGWKQNGAVTLRFVDVCHSWAATFEHKYYSSCMEVIHNLQNQLMPDNWVPRSTKDPHITAAFDDVKFNWDL